MKTSTVVMVLHKNMFSEPATEIIGGPDLFIDRGSTINLTCVVLHSPEPPAYIFWNHNEAVSSIRQNNFTWDQQHYKSVNHINHILEVTNKM